MEFRRLLPLSGVVFVVVALVGTVGLGGDTPDTDASPAEIASYYDEHSVRQAVGAFVLAAAIPFLVIFAATLAARLRGPAEPRTPWRYVLLGGAALTGAALLVAAAAVFALADGADNGASGEALQALNLLANDTWVAFNAGFGVMMLGAAGCLLGASAMPRWLGWAALVLGVLLFIPFADFFALLATLLWIIVVSILLFGRSEAAGRAAAAGA